MENKKELLNKLKALADRGINGEKEAADKLLKKLMKKYGISEEEISDNEVKIVWIDLRDDIEVRLASQILFAFFENALLYKYNSAKIKYWTELTSSQKIEFKYMLSVFLKDFRKQELIFYRAFINKNNIFPKKCKVRDLDKCSSEERQQSILAELMSQGLEKTQIRKAIGDGK